MLGNKWNAFNQANEDLENIGMLELPREYEEQVQGLHDRLIRVGQLKKNIQQEQHHLKKEHLMLAKQKSLYASKLNDIIALGSNLDWDERSGIMNKIKPYIQATQKRLKSENIGKN